MRGLGGSMAMESLDAAGIDATIRAVLRDVLGLDGGRAAAMTEATPLFGALPELDSMAVAGLLAEIEERLAIRIDDEDVDGEMLATFGSLTAFARARALG